MFLKGNTIGIDYHKSWLHLEHSWPNILLPLYLLHGIKLINTKLEYLLLCFRDETTRLWFTIPLRESFGFPFIFAQLAFITVYFKRNVSSLAQVFCSSLKFWKIVIIDMRMILLFFKTCPGHIPCIRGEGVKYNKKSNQGTPSGWVKEPKVCVQRCSCKKMTIWNHNQLVWNQAGIMISCCDVCTDFANLINVVIDVTY